MALDPQEAWAPSRGRSLGMIRVLTFLMFTMFAMTTDSVGVVIPAVIRDFHLSMAVASAFQYATMAGIALAGLGLGFLADRLGRRATIILGLSAFAATSLLFSLSDQFAAFVALLFVSGAAVGVFKAGALALIGDISSSTREHTATMNTLEGFFGVGAIIGPAVVTQLLRGGASWKWLYVIAGGLCIALTLTALLTPFPKSHRTVSERVDFGRTLRLAKDPFALAFSAAAMVYVGVEAAIYVWMPTYLAGPIASASIMATYAISIFFVLRAAGRFLGSWMLARLEWSAVLALSGLAILACFSLALLGGRSWAAVSLPLSGLFMSVVYPTLNSKGISCFPKSEHGAVAGIILSFTCLGAATAPLAMGVIGDRTGDPWWGFALATALSLVLALGLLVNWLAKPTRVRLSRLDFSQY